MRLLAVFASCMLAGFLGACDSPGLTPRGAQAPPEHHTTTHSSSMPVHSTGHPPPKATATATAPPTSTSAPASTSLGPAPNPNPLPPPPPPPPG